MFCRQMVSPRQTPGRQCEASGCNRPASGYRNLCEVHRKHADRHGHPEQKAVSMRDVRRHRREVEAYIDRRPDRERVWTLLEEHWTALAENALGQLREMTLNSKAYHKYTKIALESVRNVNDLNEPRAIIATLIGFIKLWHERPQAFLSDRTARFQFARVLRRLAPQVHTSKYARNQTVYKETPPRASNKLGEILFKHFLPVGLNVVRQMEREEEAERERVKSLYRVLREHE